MMERNPIIENMARNICDDCKKKLEYEMKKKPNAAQMTIFFLRHSCNKCKKMVLNNTKKVYDK